MGGPPQYLLAVILNSGNYSVPILLIYYYYYYTNSYTRLFKIKICKH